MQYIALSGRILIATVFLVSAWTKLRSAAAFDEFRQSTRRMRVLPERLVRPVVVLVVVSEVAIVLLAVTPTRITGLLGLAAAAVLLAALAVAIGSTVYRGVDTTCRCFGSSDTPLGVVHIVRNGALVAIAATSAVAGTQGSGPDIGGALLAALGGAVLGVLVTAMDDIRQLVWPPVRGPVANRPRSPHPVKRPVGRPGTGQVETSN